MQNTITARRIPYNLIALVALLVTGAILVGFVAGIVVGKPSSALSAPASVAQVQAQTNSPALAQFNGPTQGWVYRHDTVANKWYAYHYDKTFAGLIIDDPIELPSRPEGATSGCGLSREPDC